MSLARLPKVGGLIAQSRGRVAINWNSPLTRGLQFLICGNSFVSVGPYPLVQQGFAQQAATANGLTGRTYWNTGNQWATTALSTEFAGTKSWTIAMVATPTAATSDGVLMGTCDSPGGANYDRSMKLNGGMWSAYAWSGGVVACDSVSAAIMRTDVVVGTIDAVGQAAYCYASPYRTGTIYSNSVYAQTPGYTGYSTPQFCVGNASGSNPPSPFPVMHLILRSATFWTPEMARAFCLNPWQVLQQ